ncbi:phosphodiester glycosidase family protein [Tychonema sp. BBK16]|uniref:phosphodiester glycosidase family protein n=1 Tax=Tychonema sp. BBK16 TaxID=2699888 RepID=UPI001F1C6FE8|nr:phosphodiester glycosidase family protein [Tychonema sp. BBK16]MCF6373033.1 phosphodiester glycosidase family protein [Tychonema sp. BBK16]
MKQIYRLYRQQFWQMIGFGILLAPILLYNTPYFLRPELSQESRSLFQGITYQREFRSTPRPAVIHVVEIDLKAPGIGIFVTPGTPTPDLRETNARTTSEFVKEFNVQLAVNANFFYPHSEVVPWDYYPRSGDRVNNVGTVISNSKAYSEPDSQFPALCFATNNRAQIMENGTCPVGTAYAVAGDTLLLKNGKPIVKTQEEWKQDKPYARVVAAIDKKGEKLWLIVVDGKQRLYSEGFKLSEITEMAMQLGADTVLNLDGGGSTSLAMRSPSGAKLLNAPIQNKIPMEERPVSNHLGFYAREN